MKIPVDLKGVCETTMMTLLGKARECARPRSLLRDTFAAEALDKLDYDFRRLWLPRVSDTIFAMRAKLFDDATRDFLRRHPDACVVHMGCGLDTRVYRVDPNPRVRWYDVDYPEVLALRRKLYPARVNYQHMGTPLTDPAWIGRIRAGRPTLLLMEGVSPYLEPEAGFALLQNLADHFGTGELVLDIYARFPMRFAFLYRALHVTGAKLTWGIDGPEELTARIPGLKYLDDLQFRDFAQVPLFAGRYALRAMGLPVMRDTGRITRFSF